MTGVTKREPRQCMVALKRGACTVSPRARRSAPMAMSTTTSLRAVSGQTASSSVSLVPQWSGWGPRQRQGLAGSRCKAAQHHCAAARDSSHSGALSASPTHDQARTLRSLCLPWTALPGRLADA